MSAAHSQGRLTHSYWSVEHHQPFSVLADSSQQISHAVVAASEAGRIRRKERNRREPAPVRSWIVLVGAFLREQRLIAPGDRIAGRQSEIAGQSVAQLVVDGGCLRPPAESSQR